MKKILSLVFLIFIYNFTFADLSKVINNSDLKKLNQLSTNYRQKWRKIKLDTSRKAKIKNIPLIIDNGKSYMELAYFDSEDKPIYRITDNADAAFTISTDKVYPNSGNGYALTGAGILVREWDGGAVRASHQEFGGRATSGDGQTTTHYHSTHVAGTIMAAGVDSAAKGMAFEASLKYFDWNYDTSEMATEAANGMLLSNHSYGFGRGWIWNNGWTWNGQSTAGEDWNFGLYNSNSKEFDEIAYSAPYYLIVESAGNDRGDGPGDDPDHPNDGPYDCLADMAVAKNILTVAAVDDLTSEYTQPSDVQMSYFSSWGPCDDGRIKPDISANGVNLYSTYDGSDTDYSSISGTSMAAPSVTGSLALVQEHYHELNGSFLKAATLKALTIHCADEAGDSDGPDYEFGWGLMNTKRMIDYISAEGTTIQIHELTLQNGEEYTITLPASGLENFKATLCWTDPSGTALSTSLDPTTPALINDLDMRITQNSSTYFPWTLDRNNPANAATQNSDNSVDNIEQIVIQNPNGSYTITITHKNTLVNENGTTSNQNYSIIISGISSGYPIVNIQNPTAEENIEVGTVEQIQVSATDTDGSISHVKFYIDNQLRDTDYTSPYQYDWDTATDNLGSHTIKVIATDNENNQTEKSISVTVSLPITELFYDGFETDKGWVLSGEFERAIPAGLGGEHGNADPANAYAGSYVLGTDLTGLGSHHGDYENSLTNRALYAVSPTIDCSNASNVTFDFSRYLNVESPSYDHAYIDVYDGSNWIEIWTNSAAINDSDWSDIHFDISEYADGNSNLKIRFSIGPTDSSWQYSGWNIDELLIQGNILSSYTITSPAEGAIFAPEDTCEITWEGFTSTDNVSIDLFQAETFIQNIISSTQDDGAYNWNIPNDLPESDQYKIRVLNLENSGLYAYSNFFSVNGPNLSVSPNSIDFGEVAQNVSSSNKIFTISNTGPGILYGTITYPSELTISVQTRKKADTFNSHRNQLSYSISSGNSKTFNVTLQTSNLGAYNSEINISSNSSINPNETISISANIFAPPVLNLSQDEFQNTLQSGSSNNQTLIISNSGSSDLTYNIAIENISRTIAGPDSYGYYWIDSNEANGPGYNWYEINSLGTETCVGDDISETVSLPFAFNFYGESENSVTISSNGYLTFGTDGTDYSNDAIPNSTEPNSIICPFWTDLKPSGNDWGNVYYYSDETNNRFIVEYDNVSHYNNSDPTDNETFQVILYHNGNILYQYKTIAQNSNVTIGIENYSGTVGLALSNLENVTTGYAVLFTTNYISDNWLSLSNDSGVITANNSENITLYYDATTLPADTYQKNLVITSNDPVNSEKIIPIDLLVTDAAPPIISVSTSSLNFGDVVINTTGNRQFTISNTGGQTLLGSISCSEYFTVSELSSTNIATGRTTKSSKQYLRNRNTIDYTIGVGLTKTFNVEFSPTELISYSGTIIITHNAEGEDNTISLSGVGVPVPAPEISVSQTSINIQLTQNSQTTSSIDISNIGNADLNYNAYIQSNVRSRALLVDEDFNLGIPTGWIIEDGYNDDFTWKGISDYNDESLNGTGFIFVNSDAAGNSIDMDESFITSALDLSAYNSLILEFDQYFKYYSGGNEEKTDVDVWDGTQWNTIYTNTTNSVGGWSNPDHQSLNIPDSYISSEFKIRFHYYNSNYDYYWAIDNLKLYGSTETPSWVSITENNSGTIIPDDSANLPLAINSNDLALGNYTAYVNIFSNDPNYPSVNIPLHLNVVSAENEPNWEVVNHNSGVATIYCKIIIDGYAAGTTDVIGIFVNEECRGKGYPEIVDGNSTLVLTANSIGTSETFNFKIYDRSKDQIRDYPNTLNLTAGDVIGSSSDHFFISVGSLRTPQRLQIAKSNNSVSLSWDAVYGAKRYRIERSANALNGFTEISTTTETSYTDATGNADKYFYRIIAEDSN